MYALILQWYPLILQWYTTHIAPAFSLILHSGKPGSQTQYHPLPTIDTLNKPHLPARTTTPPSKVKPPPTLTRPIDGLRPKVGPTRYLQNPPRRTWTPVFAKEIQYINSTYQGYLNIVLTSGILTCCMTTCQTACRRPWRACRQRSTGNLFTPITCYKNIVCIISGLVHIIKQNRPSKFGRR